MARFGNASGSPALYNRRHCGFEFPMKHLLILIVLTAMVQPQNGGVDRPATRGGISSARAASSPAGVEFVLEPQAHSNHPDDSAEYEHALAEKAARLRDQARSADAATRPAAALRATNYLIS